MVNVWMPGATKLDVGNHAPTDGGPAKAIAHITWDRNASAAKPADLVPYENLRDYFGKNSTGRGVAPHILWDPFTGRITQFFPADSRSLSLVDSAGGTRTNRAGKYVVQVEALFFPYCKVDGKVYAKLSDTPCLGWEELNAWIKSLGIPDAWPMGHPVDFTSHRNESTWEKEAGWYGHQQVPENSHQDPGSWPAFKTAPVVAPKPASTPAKPSPMYAPFPGATFFKVGRKSPVIAAMHKRLVAESCNRYQSSSNPDVWGSGDVASYKAWQKKLGYTGSAADGHPGTTSWAKLHVPKS